MNATLSSYKQRTKEIQMEVQLENQGRKTARRRAHRGRRNFWGQQGQRQRRKQEG